MTNPSFSNRDFKSTPGRPRRRFHRGHLHALALVSGLIGVVALLSPGHDAEATRNPQLQVSPSVPLSFKLDLPSTEGETALPVAQLVDDRDWTTATVKPGDTLSALFARQGLGPREVYAVTHAGDDAKMLAHLHPGQKLKFDVNDGQLRALHYTIDATKTLAIRRGEDGYRTRLLEKAIETRHNFASGVIEDSLYASALRAGLSDNMIMELVAIFGWDVDFALDIRKGDRFSVVYEENYLDGEKYSEGAILAAEFVNQGHVFKAVRFTDPKGRSSYYDPNGRSMRKAFLRSPVDFRRISSRFQRARYHPILGRKRPHRGVDYAAAIGTPIKASGDGKIVFRGWKGGYGRVIIIQHGGRYSTLYGHMSRFRGGLHTGSRVRQGQIIGYVGQSGLATGPHLHYEFRVNGVHRNPLTVKLPNAAPINTAFKEQFQQQASVLLDQLQLYRKTQLAAQQP